MGYEDITIVALFILVYAAISGRADRTMINGALVFTSFGFIVGNSGLGLLDLNVTSEGLRVLAELTLALVLFTDAANADLGVLRKTIAVPRRLLTIGLPITILFGTLVGALIFPGLDLIEVALLATILAPTDAALGKAVVSNQSVPVGIRQGLNVESGLNDGICVPILFVFLALATGEAAPQSSGILALKLVSEEIGIGLVVGIGLTFPISQFLRVAAERGWMNESWSQLPVTALAVCCFSAAQWFGGSGFIAAFSGGLLFGWLAGKAKVGVLLTAEGTGDILTLITWVVFGATIVGMGMGLINWQIVCYALLSLTVIRILPVWLCLIGTGPRIAEKLFIGWFGPRGLASIVFAVIVLNKNLPGGATIAATVACTIVLSVITHGLSANPLAMRLARSEESQGDH
ncbi:cation:proton antiporter [Microbulbifer spongiae]|uniref:Cation:proton antiporter n=1 Tax=Microbulbifer spongiae TaxID=2944933 RepID=A0ABY9EFN6_9GAMM|nr:cation:proton antiporter [Microbulbifer sp. MI-G]WKD51077.1 cation:proton antiporter [Microbulbifer sp. MI-G]